MTDFVAYTAAEYAPDAPGTALHFQRWFQNWEAGFQGAVGAERLRIGALQRLNPGAAIRVRRDGTLTAAAGLLTVNAIQAGFLQVGTVRITFEHQGAGNANVIRSRGGGSTTMATFSNTGSFVARSVDVPVLPGDVVIVGVTSSNISAAAIRNARLQTNGEDYFPVSIGAGDPEGNTYA